MAADVDWPDTIPQEPLYGTFVEQRQRNVVAFNPDVGTPKMRRRSTSVCTITTCTFQMSDDELGNFLDFYNFALADGTLPFNWVHPQPLWEGESFVWFFSPTESPKLESTTYNINHVTCTLHRLP